MGFRIVVVFFLAAALLPGITASSGQTAQAEPEPRYDSFNHSLNQWSNS